jgi:hypothetical protein
MRQQNTLICLLKSVTIMPPLHGDLQLTHTNTLQISHNKTLRIIPNLNIQSHISKLVHKLYFKSQPRDKLQIAQLCQYNPINGKRKISRSLLQDWCPCKAKSSNLEYDLLELHKKTVNSLTESLDVPCRTALLVAGG